MDPNLLSGFDPRVQQQLSNLAHTQRGRRGSLSSQSTASQASYYTTYSSPYHPRGGRTAQAPEGFNQFSQPPPGLDSFPPLGAQKSDHSYMAPQSHVRSQDQYPLNNGQGQQSQSAAQQFFAQARGGRVRGRGRGRADHNNAAVDTNGYTRPSPNRQQQSYNPHQQQNFLSHEQRDINRQRHMMQSDYLNAAVARSAASMLTSSEIQQKQAFAERIEVTAREIVERHINTKALNASVKLRAYGSLANSFGTAGCDMDLLLLVSAKAGEYADISEEIKRDFEKALLDQGIGARLLTNTRVPILKVCERPNPELLRNLRDCRHRWEIEAEDSANLSLLPSASAPPRLSQQQEAEQARAVLELDNLAAEISLPPSPPPTHAMLEFDSDCGIQCDINFANHIALYNSKLLWQYGQCDARVRHVGIFVKKWAKARDINTPYRGTLSSYGLINMVLHYMVNVAQPPVLPNLQEMGKSDGWTETPLELVDGHDVRFCKDMKAIKARMESMQPNRSTPGALLLGFFKYYGQGTAGFRWTEQVISIRTPGGILSKQDKDWTRAKWSEDNTNVRQRYLLAIEDPFEIEHNVGRTVGHHGLVAIRDEFRRAWSIINNITSVQSLQGPVWASRLPGSDDIDLMSPADSRGDLLRQDADHRKLKAEQARQLRKDLELKEELAKKSTLEDGSNPQVDGNDHGMEEDSTEAFETALLIQNFQHQDEKTSRMRSRKPERERVHDISGDDNDDNDGIDGIDEHDHTVKSEDSGPVDQMDQTWHEPDLQDESRHSYPSTEHRTNNWENEEVMKPQIIDSSMIWTAEMSDEEVHGTDTNEITTINTNDWSCSADIANVHPNTREPSKSNSSDQHIHWTSNSKAGRWLLKRDALIRSGDWVNPTSSDQGRLNASFPYDPNISSTRLASLNARLEALYRDTLYPAFSPVQNEQVADSHNINLNLADEANNISTWTDQEEQTKETTTTTSEDWPVGEDIPWTAENDVGRWLVWRDRIVKTGAEFNPRGWAGIGDKISTRFPYNPRETMANISRMNQEIALHFDGLTFPNRDMWKSDQFRCTEALLNAVQRVDLQRGTIKFASTNRFDEIYHSSNSYSLDQVQYQSRRFASQSFVVNHAKVSTSWASSNSASRWLQRRDRLIEEGTWQDEKVKDTSIFGYLCRLYPYQAVVNPVMRAKENEELDANFTQAALPHKPSHDDGPAIRAILKIVEGRHGDAEADKIRILLSMFQGKTATSTRLHESESYARTLQEPQSSDRYGEMKAIEALASQLRPPQSCTPKKLAYSSAQAQDMSAAEDERAEVRRHRLAYYERQDKASETDKIVEIVLSNHPRSQRRDSGAEGSWNNPRSPDKTLKQSMTADRLASQTDFERACLAGKYWSSEAEERQPNMLPDRTEEPTTQHDYSGPRNLFEPDQHTEPNVIPIVTAADFPMDPAQIVDIKNIKAGGNGCVRGEISPFLVESDRFSWGGAGAMAHKSDSTKQDWEIQVNREAHDAEASKVLDEELPGIVEW